MIRIAVIDREKCRAPNKCDYICIRICPSQKNNIKVFSISEDKKPIIDENYCIGCGLCAKKCPFGAIKIINLAKEPESFPVFQYGPNMFRLYRLPIPKAGYIVGIIGRNGMGKTTAIKILAGLLKPNFGEYNREFSEKEIIARFKGTELQNYFEKLYNKEIKLSYKPQDITLFIKLYGEKTVKELFDKIEDNKKELKEEVIKKLDIDKIINRKVKELSGGELQKVLIALTSLKDFNIYLLDEPTSYLDIFERLRIATYIDSLKREDNSIIVIDHDLLFLDHISDTIFIIYGVQRAYGVVSYPIGAREGINQYLEGFIRRENLRIRDKPIRLDIKSFSDKKEGEKILEWKNLKINLGEFLLEANEGYISKNTVVGVLGRNGIGKTTFAKAIAGIIKYDGYISKEVSISYKPQYLELSEGEKYITVGEFLRKLNPDYKAQFNEYLFDLGISDLLDHELGSLSGGELQTVITFGCLIQDKDLYLLDEPFSYLDVEQRIRLSKFIREIIKQREKAALVIEHDLLFLEYVSDKIIVFLGEPGKYGKVYGPMENNKALNMFLKEVGITIRRDPETKRPKINKPDSYLDRVQKSSGIYYQDF